MAAQPFNGWQDISLYSAEGLRNAAGNQAQTYTAPTLSPYTPTQTASVGAAPQIGSAGVLRDQRAYMDPYTRDVIDTSLSGYDRDAGMRVAAEHAAGARNNAFGGSRFAIGEAMTAGELARNRGALEASLGSDAWRWSLGQAMGQAGQNQQAGLQAQMQQAQLAQQAKMASASDANAFAMQQAQLQSQEGQFNAQLKQQQQQQQLQALALLGDSGSAYAGNDRADLSLIADLGAQQRAIETQQAQAELAQLQAQGQMMGTIPVGAYTGQTIDSTSSGTQTQSGGLLGSILGGLAGGIGGII